MIKRGSEPLRAAAIPLIQAYHIEAGGKSLFRAAKDVRRVARPFQAVHQQESGMFARFRVPVAMAAHLSFRLHVKEPWLGCWQPREAPPQERRRDGHQVAIAKQPVRDELFHSLHRRDCRSIVQPGGPEILACRMSLRRWRFSK